VILHHFTWDWLADLCADEGIPFVLGHACDMKAMHGGMLPQAYVYLANMRATRDLLRRRMHLAHKRGERLAHIQNTHSQYNLPASGKKIAYKANRDGVAERFVDPPVQEFASYWRLVKCVKESGGKRHGTSGTQIGHAHLKWAFSEKDFVSIGLVAESLSCIVCTSPPYAGYAERPR